MKKTFSQTKEQAQRERGWIVVDVAGLPVGRAAAEVAALIRGKHKPTFTPHIDCGDYVVVLNASQVKLTGNKARDKMHHWHTGYVGGIKSVSAGEMMETKPERLFFKAVKGMLPRGALGHQMVKKLKVYTGEEHPHLAQQPEHYEFKWVKGAA